MSETADAISRVVEKECGPQGMVSWYMMAGLMYYHFDESILSDGRFDEIAKLLLANWDSIKHNHKHFITKEELEAGTLSLKLEEFPMMTRGGANSILKGLGRKLTSKQEGTLFFVDFVPPERLRDNADLYVYSTQGQVNRSWNDHKKLAAKELAARLAEKAGTEEAPVVVRTRQRPSPASPVAQEAEFDPMAVRVRPRPAPEPVPEVRTRSRPVITPTIEPVIEVRTRTRPK